MKDMHNFLIFRLKIHFLLLTSEYIFYIFLYIPPKIKPKILSENKK